MGTCSWMNNFVALCSTVLNSHESELNEPISQRVNERA